MKTINFLIKSFYGTSLLLMVIIILSSIANPGSYQFRLCISSLAAIASLIMLIKFQDTLKKECDEEERRLCQSLRKDLKNIKGSIALFAGLAVYFFISYHI